MITRTDTLTIEHKLGTWDGTFSVTVTCLINDLLSDGQPIGVRLSGVSPENNGEFYGQPHTVTAVENGELVTDTGERFEIDNIFKVEVS